MAAAPNQKVVILRDNTQRVTLTLTDDDGQSYDLQTWDAKEGGEVASEAGDSFSPGGMEPAIALGGSAKTGNITLRRHVGKGIWPYAAQLIDAARESWDAKIVQLPLVSKGKGYAHQLVYNGKVVRFTPPTSDSTSSGVVMMEVEVQVDGYPVLGASGSGA